MPDTAHTDVAVIIPAKNEQQKIGATVTASTKISDLVIVVDDGSHDATADLARAAGALVVRRPRSHGNFVTLIGHRAGGNGVLNLSGTNNNAMDSWGNRSTVYNGAGYDIAGGSGDCQTFAKNSNDNNVNPFNSDEVSAWKTNSGC